MDVFAVFRGIFGVLDLPRRNEFVEVGRSLTVNGCPLEEQEPIDRGNSSFLVTLLMASLAEPLWISNLQDEQSQ